MRAVLNDEQETAIKHLNADYIVNTSKESLTDVMKQELEAGTPVDITVDCLGGSLVGECMPYVNFDGRWIMIAE